MKKILLILTIMLCSTNVYAQFNNEKANSYVSNIFENVQGHIEETGEYDGNLYVMGRTSEYLDFSLVRTMISIVSSSDERIQVIKAWTKSGTSYEYGVVIDRKHVILLRYRDEDKLLVLMHTEAK
jgi:negative regulator of sigma E activity